MTSHAAYAIPADQPVTNVVTPLASNPPLATPLTFTGPATPVRRGQMQFALKYQF